MSGKTLYLLYTWFLFSFIFSQTSRFQKTFRESGGDLLTSATIYIENVHTSTQYNLTEHPTRTGVYYHTAVPYGHYDIYVNGSKIQENYYFGAVRQRNFIEAVDSNGDNKIETAGIEDLAITSQKIATGAVSSAKIASSAVTEDKITNSAVTTDKINNNAVTTGKVNDLAINTDKIAASAVTQSKLASFAIDSSNIASQGVAHSDLQLQSVENNNVKNGTLTLSKFTPASLTQIGAPDTVIGLTADDRTLEDVGGGDIGFKMRSDMINYEIFVSKDTDDSYYHTIQNAIDAFGTMSASQQGYVYIYPGTYNEVVEVSKYVNIIGQGEGVIISDSIKAESGDTLLIENIQISKLYLDSNNPKVRIKNCYFNGSVPIIMNSGNLNIDNSQIYGAYASEPAIDINGGVFYINFTKATFAKIEIDDASGIIEGGTYKTGIGGNWGINIDNSIVTFKDFSLSGITSAEVDSTAGPDIEIDESDVIFRKCNLDGPIIATGNTTTINGYSVSGYGKARLSCGSGSPELNFYDWSPVYDWTSAGGMHNVEIDAGSNGSITLYNPNINFTSYKGLYQHNGNPIAIYDGHFYCYGGAIRDGGGDGNSYSSMIGVRDSCDAFVIIGTKLLFDGDTDEATNGISFTSTPSANIWKKVILSDLFVNLNGTGHCINWNGLESNTINDSDSIAIGPIEFKSRNSSAHKYHDGYYDANLVSKLFPYLKFDRDIDIYRNVTIHNDQVIDSTLILDQTKTKFDSGRVYLTIGQDDQTDSTYNTLLFYKAYYPSIAGDSDSVKLVIEFKNATQNGASTRYNKMSIDHINIEFIRTAGDDIASHLRIDKISQFDNGTISGTTQELHYEVDSLNCTSSDYYLYPGIELESSSNTQLIFKLTNYWPSAAHTAAIFAEAWMLENVNRIYFEDY